MNEDLIVVQTLKVLSRFFHIKREVWSEDRKKRIDAVIQCKDTGAHFGIEFKHTDKKTGKDLGALTKQAMDYSRRKFYAGNKYQILPVFVAPPISIEMLICPAEYIEVDGKKYYCDRHREDHPHHTVNGWLGALNIGELRSIRHQDKSQDYFIFSFSNQIIWSSKKEYLKEMPVGLHQENYKKLITKLNHDYCIPEYI